MKLTLSYEQIVNALEVLKLIGNQKMVAAISYKVLKNVARLGKEVTVFQGLMKEIVMKYGVSMGEGSYEIPKDKDAVYKKELGELLAKQVEVEIAQLNIKDMNCQISPFELLQIEWMLTE